MIRQCLRVGIVVALGMLVPACAKSNGPDPEAAVKAAERLADAICACPDLECAKKAAKDGSKALDEFKALKPDAKAEASLKAAGERAATCVGKLSTPAPEAAPEAAPADAAPVVPDAAAAAAPPATK